MPVIAPIDRRAFLVSAAAAGGGLALGFEIPFGLPAARAQGAPGEVNAWLLIQPDDTVIMRVAKSEMGQGSFTALPMLVAEELECDWSKVKAEFPRPDENLRRKRAWGDMSTGGSRAVRSSQEVLRKAGAAAREMLISAAAAQWSVPAVECRAQKSIITHTPSGRTLRFGEVVAAAATLDPPKKVKLKDPKDWTIAGKPTRRLEIADKVQGKPIYGIDVRLPDMLYAALSQCPVFKGTLTSVDESKLAGIKGIRKLVKMKDAVAVVADSWWQAKKGLDALQVAWDDGGNGKVSSDSIKEFLRGGLVTTDAGIGRKDGDVVTGLAQSVKRIEAEYYAPFLSHATMEPQNCTAHVTADKAEIWVSTQNGEAALMAAAQALGMPPANVTVHKMMVGGGFGRRGGVQDFVPHAVLIAKEAGRPVQTVWSREEDMRHDFYRPVAMAKMTAGLDASGMPVAWRVRLTGNSIRGTLTPDRLGGVDTHFQEGFTAGMSYDVANYLVDHAMRNTHVPVGFWRCVNNTQNAFFKESFIDEMAHVSEQDPYQFRRKLLSRHPHAQKLIGVLDAVAKQAEWGAPLPQGVHRGIALHECYGSYTAAVIEVAVDAGGKLKVHRVVCAMDSGHVVNPLTVEMQIEGSIVYGLTAALYGEITIKNGAVEQSNFNDYAMLRMADMPKVESIVMASGGFWGGCGEPPVSVAAPALCNAIFAATGKRIRSLPLKNHDLRKA